MSDRQQRTPAHRYDGPAELIFKNGVMVLLVPDDAPLPGPLSKIAIGPAPPATHPSFRWDAGDLQVSFSAQGEQAASAVVTFPGFAHVADRAAPYGLLMLGGLADTGLTWEVHALRTPDAKPGPDLPDRPDSRDMGRTGP